MYATSVSVLAVTEIGLNMYTSRVNKVLSGLSLLCSMQVTHGSNVLVFPIVIWTDRPTVTMDPAIVIVKP